MGGGKALVGMVDRPEESAESEDQEAQAAALGVPAPYRGQGAWRGDSIPASRRARALAESSPAQWCRIKLKAFAAVYRCSFAIAAAGITG
ncbi:hypothetical protein CKJ56_25605 [Mycobacterium intracellulare subsp. chimaera]|nr:hypothetical protein CKJ58_25410 [Mycobacterium intracellulare subsp. chimaera]PBA53264.1 hypothetical protein CKJ57_00110 [Mycobacterium intracellulare subsp. chimaera]PBA60066.1 hypothetical protein CKJ56_25605 [Mycobacterium intracellulare subsp. chimaera]